jgi:hypothetical protein
MHLISKVVALISGASMKAPFPAKMLLMRTILDRSSISYLTVIDLATSWSRNDRAEPAICDLRAQADVKLKVTFH